MLQQSLAESMMVFQNSHVFIIFYLLTQNQTMLITARAHHIARLCFSHMLIALCALAGTGIASAQAPTSAPQKILYVRAQFADKPIGIDDATWQKRIQTLNHAAEDFWRFNSYGHITAFEAKVTDIIQLPASTHPTFEEGKNIYGTANAMKQAAQAAGWDLKQFDQIVLSYPGLPRFPAGALGTPGTIWMPGQNPSPSGFTHEFGHALGVGHANAFENPTAPYPGEHREGRDGLFMMGSDNGVNLQVDGRRAPINLPMRHMMGFIDKRLVRKLSPQQLKQPTTYRIFAYDRQSLEDDVRRKRTLAIRFDADGKDFWITFAPSMAKYWSKFNAQGWAKGVAVHQVEGSITRILDFTPGSQGGTGNEADYVDTRDGALIVGKQYAFPNSNIGLGVVRTGMTKDGIAWIDIQAGQTLAARQ